MAEMVPSRVASGAVGLPPADHDSLFFDSSADGKPKVKRPTTGEVMEFARTGTHAQRMALTAASHAGELFEETDTGLIYLGTGAGWAVFKAEGTVRKTAAETLNNISALQNDDQLLFPVEPNEVWGVHHALAMTAASTTPDAKVGWSLPSGTYEISRNSELGTATGISPGAVQPGNIAFALVNGKVFVWLYSLLVIGATGGTANMTWAHSQSAVAEDVTMNVNSCLFLKKLTQ